MGESSMIIHSGNPLTRIGFAFDFVVSHHDSIRNIHRRRCRRRVVLFERFARVFDSKPSTSPRSRGKQDDSRSAQADASHGTCLTGCATTLECTRRVSGGTWCSRSGGTWCSRSSATWRPRAVGSLISAPSAMFATLFSLLVYVVPFIDHKRIVCSPEQFPHSNDRNLGKKR